MQENMKEYLTEKEAKEKRLEVYTEKIQEKVLSRSSETIRQLVEERHRQKMTQQEIADVYKRQILNRFVNFLQDADLQILFLSLSLNIKVLILHWLLN